MGTLTPSGNEVQALLGDEIELFSSIVTAFEFDVTSFSDGFASIG